MLGTLVIQGLTLRPLLLRLRLPNDSILATELGLAREAALNAAMAALERDTSAAADRLRQEYAEALSHARGGGARERAGCAGNGPSASDQGEQSLHQLAVWLGQRFEDREMVGPVDRQQMPRQSALDPRLGVVDRLAA